MTDPIHNLVDKGFKAVNRLLAKVGGTYVSERTKKGHEYREPRLHLHWQNLNDNEKGQPKGPPTEGRFWLRLGREHGRSPALCVSWHFASKVHIFSTGVEISGHGGGDHDITAHLSTLPLALYVSLEGVFGKAIHDAWSKKYRYDDREVRISLSRDSEAVMGGITARWHFWVDPDSWSSEIPKWKHGHFDVIDFVFGETKHEERRITKTKAKIPMPEGSYDAEVEIVERTWRRPRWPLPTTMRTGRVAVDIGIPHQGKGENSWDCGEDACFGLSTPADNVSQAVGNTVRCVLRDRERYDGNINAVYPSPEARRKIVEARRKDSVVPGETA